MPINLPVTTNGTGKTHPGKQLCQRVFAHATETGGLRGLSAAHGLDSFVTFLTIKKSKNDGWLRPIDARPSSGISFVCFELLERDRNRLDWEYLNFLII
ncbi:MAG: hypothetical protein C4518_18420 [Desulfobacteraceae bacterium]|nr:MAG: hypothetical protein C4518_18420 [Desulfobacteraceae bacterium]